jgi:Flp pilus assembly CpaF family ATPase
VRIWYNNILDNARSFLDVRSNRIRIGRGTDNEIVLPSPFVADEAAVLYKREGAWELVALGGFNGVQVNGKELLGGDRHAVAGGQIIKIFPFTLQLELAETQALSANAVHAALDVEMSQLSYAIHLDLLAVMDLAGTEERARTPNDEYLLTLERNIEEIARGKVLQDRKRGPLITHIAGHCLRAELLNELIASSKQGSASPWDAKGHWSRLVSLTAEREAELKAVAKQCASLLGLHRAADLSARIGLVEREFWNMWETHARNVQDEFRQYLALRYLKKEIKDIVFGYGPLEDLLRTPTVSEIMVVDRDHIYVEKQGILENSGRRFISDEVTQAIIERIVSRVGRRIDKSSPLVNARLSDGSRLNAVIPPLALSGPCLTIRKFPARKLTIDDLIVVGSMTRTVAEFLRAAVITRKNILISGGTGTGKTTLLNCLSDFIPDKERIITVEDTAELQLKKEHVVRLETREANIEGAGAYTIRDLVKNALRMRPDRIVVGECRGGEALDMLQAMNTGHDGSLTTIHANTAEDMILRLEVLVQMAADLPIDSIHRQIASAIDLVVQLRRMRDGRRRVVQVTEIIGVDQELGGVRLKDLFMLTGEQSDAQLMPTGSLPTFMGELIQQELIQLESFYL